MNRFHIHKNVDGLDTSIAFYTSLFGTMSTVKNDYVMVLEISIDQPGSRRKRENSVNGFVKT